MLLIPQNYEKFSNKNECSVIQILWVQNIIRIGFYAYKMENM